MKDINYSEIGNCLIVRFPEILKISGVSSDDVDSPYFLMEVLIKSRVKLEDFTELILFLNNLYNTTKDDKIKEMIYIELFENVVTNESFVGVLRATSKDEMLFDFENFYKDWILKTEKTGTENGDSHHYSPKSVV